MYHSIRHQTKFRYNEPVRETIMEVRLQPRTEWTQHLLSFDLQVLPRARVLQYRDHLGNTVHHFSLPGSLEALSIISTALVDVQPFREWPDALPVSAWSEVDSMIADGEHHEMLLPSDFARPTPLLAELAVSLGVTRQDDPMTVLRRMNREIFRTLEYVPQSTRVDSSIDETLQSKRGVCQDFAHIMIALARLLKIPCRYVSGYVAPREFTQERAAAGYASHAWVEALLPGLGWVGFDPTNDRLVADRHVRCAIGRDYADVPPTKGVYKGDGRGELHVHVMVKPTEALTRPELEFNFPVIEEWMKQEGAAQAEPAFDLDPFLHQQQQQQ
jgi:transglutaminase-like putative cysteine protease